MIDRIAILKLLQELVRMEVLTAATAQDLERNFKYDEQERFDAFLLQEGLVTKEDLLKALATIYQVPFMDADGYFFQTHLLQMFPKDFLMRNGIIPADHDGAVMFMVAADPSDPNLLMGIGEHVSYDIQFFVGIYGDIIDAIGEYYEPALTEHVDEEEEIRIQDLDDLPVAQEERDEDIFLKDKLEGFAKTEDQLEHDEISRLSEYTDEE